LLYKETSKQSTATKKNAVMHSSTVLPMHQCSILVACNCLKYFLNLQLNFSSKCINFQGLAILSIIAGKALFMEINTSSSFWLKKKKKKKKKKNLKFWPINCQCLQLQNNSAIGVEVNPEAYSCTPCFEIKKNLVV